MKKQCLGLDVPQFPSQDFLSDLWIITVNFLYLILYHFCFVLFFYCVGSSNACKVCPEGHPFSIDHEQEIL